ncbi:unnamed protein product, partial [Timema podura]|nr:unnamed protein product [Timema podura]
MATLLDNLRNLEPGSRLDSHYIMMDPDRPVMVPGDKEMSRSKKVVKDGGILYDVVQIRAMVRVLLYPNS